MLFWESLILKDKKKGIGFKYAFNGIKNAYLLERNFKIHTVFAIIIIVSSIVFGLTALEWVSILVVIGFVLVAEMFNTAIEHMLDYLNPSIHPSAKVIKDLSAGGVLIAAMIAVIVGLIIFIPKLIDIFI